MRGWWSCRGQISPANQVKFCEVLTLKFASFFVHKIVQRYLPVVQVLFFIFRLIKLSLWFAYLRA